MVNESFNTLWDNLLEYGFATEEELHLVTSINGSTVESLESVLYVRTGYRDWEQYIDCQG
jgi:hypothetical protein